MKRNFNLKRTILTALIAVVAVLAVVFVIHLRKRNENKPVEFDGSFTVEIYTLESGMVRDEFETEWGLMFGDITETGEYLVKEEVNFLEGDVFITLLESTENFTLILSYHEEWGYSLDSIEFEGDIVELSNAYWAIYIDNSASDVGLSGITLEDLDGSILRFMATPY